MRNSIRPSQQECLAASQERIIADELKPSAGGYIFCNKFEYLSKVKMVSKRRKNSDNGKPIVASVWCQVEKYLIHYYSPEQIAACLKK